MVGDIIKHWTIKLKIKQLSKKLFGIIIDDVTKIIAIPVNNNLYMGL